MHRNVFGAMVLVAAMGCGESATEAPPPPAPINVSVTPMTLELTVGQEQALAATVSGTSNVAVTWRSNAADVADVSSSGMVVARSPGVARVTATSVADPTQSAAADVAVAAPAPVAVQIVPVNDTVIGVRSVEGTSGVVTCELKWTAHVSGGGTATWNDVAWTIQAPGGTPTSRTDPAMLYGASASPFTTGAHTFRGTWHWSRSQTGQPRYTSFTVTATMSYTEQATGQRRTTTPITMRCEPPAPEPSTVTTGVPVTGVSAAAGYSKLYRIAVPAGASRLTVNTAPGTGDLDLYVRRDATPTLTAADCKSEGETSAESCVIDDPAAGDWYILLYAYAPFSNVTLTATVTTASATPGFTITGSPTSLSVAAGGTTTLTVNAARTGGFTGAITLSAEGLPAGVTAPNATIAAGATSALLTFTASAASAGNASVTVRARATGQADRTITVPLTVTTSNPGGQGVIELLYAFQLAPGSSFDTPHGRSPLAGLAEGADGNLYGVNSQGGMPANGATGFGTLFRITTGGQLSTLVTFDRHTNGEYPTGALAAASDGNLYGVTGDGTFFRVSTTGVFTEVVRSGDLSGARGRLLQGADGAFYGTTIQGGTQSRGSVFRVTAAGAVSTLASFTGTNGAYPYAGLVAGTDGNLYGTTSAGGIDNLAGGHGTVFRITPGGQLTTMVQFTGSGSTGTGSQPRSQLVLGPDGNLYGTTRSGGDYGSGTVFRVTPAGAITKLYSFNSVTPALGCNCGPSSPYGGLVLAGDGNLYGTTMQGKKSMADPGTGAVFRITTSGAFSVVAYFDTQTGGNAGDMGPMDNLILGRDGRLYGTTVSGGTARLGTVFRVNLGQ